MARSIFGTEERWQTIGVIGQITIIVIHYLAELDRSSPAARSVPEKRLH